VEDLALAAPTDADVGVGTALLNKAHEVVRQVNQLLLYLHRLVLYAVLGLPVVGAVSAAGLLSSERPTSPFEDLVWDVCLWAILQLGPTFVKFAQWASARPDLYPPALIARLEKLQDDVQVPLANHY